jgi:hypothetical protein
MPTTAQPPPPETRFQFMRLRNCRVPLIRNDSRSRPNPVKQTDRHRTVGRWRVRHIVGAPPTVG